MTAGELIAILTEWPDDAPVRVMVRDKGAYREIAEVWRTSLPGGAVIIEA